MGKLVMDYWGVFKMPKLLGRLLLLEAALCSVRTSDELGRRVPGEKKK